MIDIYVNEATGKKIKLYKQTMVHVYDHEDPKDILDFTDTAQGVAEWCMENLMTGDEYYDEMEQAYANKENTGINAILSVCGTREFYPKPFSRLFQLINLRILVVYCEWHGHFLYLLHPYHR